MSTTHTHTHTHTHTSFCVCVCWFVPVGPFNSVSISSFTWGSWWRSGTRATLPTQHQKLLMSYCCTLLWNIIALWCVNKAGACCHSICSPAGQTGTTSRGEEEERGRGRKRRKAPGSSWSAGFGVQESWLALLKDDSRLSLCTHSNLAFMTPYIRSVYTPTAPVNFNLW